MKAPKLLLSFFHLINVKGARTVTGTKLIVLPHFTDRVEGGVYLRRGEKEKGYFLLFILICELFCVAGEVYLFGSYLLIQFSVSYVGEMKKNVKCLLKCGDLILKGFCFSSSLLFIYFLSLTLFFFYNTLLLSQKRRTRWCISQRSEMGK